VKSGYIAPEPGPPSTSYDEEIAKLKEWIRRRLTWLDENIPQLRKEIVVNLPESYLSRIPTRFYLYPNYPNPFNSCTMITYQLPVTSEVELSVYNLLGQKMATLISARKQAGQYLVEWKAEGFASGIYIFCIKANNFSSQRKMLLLE
jgi:hypothetical protein